MLVNLQGTEIHLRLLLPAINDHGLHHRQVKAVSARVVRYDMFWMFR